MIFDLHVLSCSLAYSNRLIIQHISILCTDAYVSAVHVCVIGSSVDA